MCLWHVSQAGRLRVEKVVTEALWAHYTTSRTSKKVCIALLELPILIPIRHSTGAVHACEVLKGGGCGFARVVVEWGRMQHSAIAHRLRSPLRDCQEQNGSISRLMEHGMLATFTVRAAFPFSASPEVLCCQFFKNYILQIFRLIF